MDISKRRIKGILIQKPNLPFSLILNERKFKIQKKETKLFSIIKNVVKRNVVDFNIYSYIDGLIRFKQGGYFS